MLQFQPTRPHRSEMPREEYPRVADNSVNRPVVMALIGGVETPAHLDSGADVSMVSPELVQEKDYTGETRSARVVGGLVNLPVATVQITAQQPWKCWRKRAHRCLA